MDLKFYLQAEKMGKTVSKKAKKLKYLFILNPVAGVGARRDFLLMIDNACKEKGVSHKILFTRCAGDAKKIIEKKFDKFDVFVAVGGDGTMNEVGSALAGTSGIMGLIPAGSGNALGRELGLSMKPKEAVNQLLNGHAVKIDTGLANGHRFMNLCGLGFDEHIARCFNKSTSRGPIPYFKATMKEFFGYKPGEYEVEADGIVTKHTSFVIAVTNTSQYGNNAFIAPQATVTDGILDFIALKPFGFFGAIGLGFRLFNKTIHQSELSTYYKTQKVTIKGKDLNFHIDGEPVNNDETLVISIDPLSLNIIVP